MSLVPEPRVARCAPGEAAAIAEFVERVISGEIDADVREPLRQDLARVEAGGADSGFLFTARDGDDLAGTLVVSRDTPTSARLAWLAVAPAFRHHGVGRALLGAALEECRAARIRAVTTWSFAFSAAAARLYWEFGFRVCALSDLPVGGRRRETVLFEKRLAPPPASV